MSIRKGNYIIAGNGGNSKYTGANGITIENGVISIKEDALNTNQINGLEDTLEAKQDIISDLETIRSGASAGATALQTVPSEYITETELSNYHDDTKADDTDVVHKENEETITGKKIFTGGSGGSSSDVSIQTKNALAVGDETQTAYTGIYNHRKCGTSGVNTAGFLVNSDGSAKFTHKKGTSTAIGTADDSYIRFDSKTLVYSDGVNASSEKDILHTGNAYNKDSVDTLLSNKQETLVSGTNIKTINGESILGEGDIEIKLNTENITVDSSFIPDTTKTYDLGSEDKRFRAIYVDEAYLSTDTLYLGDTAILGTTSESVNVTADEDQSILVKTTGEGSTQLLSDKSVDITSKLDNSSVNITARGNNGAVNISGTKDINLTATNISLSGATTIANLNVTGTTTTVHSQDLSVKDNLIEINAGETGSGVSAGQAGLKVNRGDLPDYRIMFDEADDMFKVGMNGDLETIASQNYVNTQLESYSTTSEVEDLLDDKQDVINDLETIRSGASAGATAIQNTNDCVHTTGNETIGGTKVFTSNPFVQMNGRENRWQSKCLTYTQGVAPSESVFGGISTRDKNHIEIGTIYTSVDTNNNIGSFLWVKDPREGGTNSRQLGITAKPDGTFTTSCIAPTEDTTTSTQIDTVGARNTKLQSYQPLLTSGTNIKTINGESILGEGDLTIVADTSDCVHTSGDETINGVKTFTSEINGTSMYANWGDLAEYYLTDKEYPKGTLVQLGGEKEFTIATTFVNAIISSEPGLVINGNMKDEGQAIALVGRVPVRVIGKVNKFDKLVLSEIPGVARKKKWYEIWKPTIARALESKTTEDEGLILTMIKFTL